VLHEFDRQPPAGAGLVLDDHVLPEIFRHLLPDEPREQIVAAAGREADDHADRLAGIILRVRWRRCERRHREESRKESAASTGRWHGHSPWYFSAAALPANMSFRQVLRRRSWWRNGGTCLPSWRFDADPNRVL